MNIQEFDNYRIVYVEPAFDETTWSQLPDDKNLIIYKLDTEIHQNGILDKIISKSNSIQQANNVLVMVGNINYSHLISVPTLEEAIDYVLMSDLEKELLF